MWIRPGRSDRHPRKRADLDKTESTATSSGHVQLDVGEIRRRLTVLPGAEIENPAVIDQELVWGARLASSFPPIAIIKLLSIDGC